MIASSFVTRSGDRVQTELVFEPRTTSVVLTISRARSRWSYSSNNRLTVGMHASVVAWATSLRQYTRHASNVTSSNPPGGSGTSARYPP